MISVIVYGRNDVRGYGMSKRVAIGLNTLAEQIDEGSGEVLFVDYNTDDHLPTLPELIADTLTETTRNRLRILRVRHRTHRVHAETSPLAVLEPVARNVALRRSNPNSRWILSTNTDVVLVSKSRERLIDIVDALPPGQYGLPRFELPERAWESFDRLSPRDCTEKARRWGREARLDEMVFGAPDVLFDNPGDFQLVPRADLYAIDGFDERMVLGWHVDHNLVRRLEHRLGAVRDLSERFALYHCGHSRSATQTHSADRTENDIGRFVDGIDKAELPGQRHRWGCADTAVEEISLAKGPGGGVLDIARTVMSPLRAAPLSARYAPGAFDAFWYDAGHVATHLLDLVSTYSRQAVIVYAGVRRDLFTMVLSGLARFGFMYRVLVPDVFAARLAAFDRPEVQVGPRHSTLEAADLIIAEFGLARDETGSVRDATTVEPTEEEIAALDGVAQFLSEAAILERRRLGLGAAARTLVAVNAVHTRYEALVGQTIAAQLSPFTTRLRYGPVRDGRPTGWAELATELAEQLGSSIPVGFGDIARGRDLLRHLLTDATIDPTRRLDIAAAAPLLRAMAATHGFRDGYDAAAQAEVAARLDACLQPDPDLAGRLDLVPARMPAGRGALSGLAANSDWARPGWLACAARFGVTDVQAASVRNGWIWERAQLLWGLERLIDAPASRHVLVVCEHPERLVSMLSAAYGRVSVLDIRTITGDAEPTLCKPWDFDPQPAYGSKTVALADDGAQYDAIVLPHAAAFRCGCVGLGAVLGSLRGRLAEGGILALAAEVALLGPWRMNRPDRSLAADGLPDILNRSAGLELVDDGDFELSADDVARIGSADDLAAGRPVLGTRHDGDALWPCVWFFRATDRPAGETATITRTLADAIRNALLGEQLPGLRVGVSGRRDASGTIVARNGPPGHVFYGPYLPLARGTYSVDGEVSGIVVTGSTTARLKFEAVVGNGVVKKAAINLKPGRASRPLSLRFEVGSAEANALAPTEVRLWTDGAASFHVSTIRLSRLSA